MQKKIKTLIVDDHPAIIEGYKNILRMNKIYSFEFYEANSFEMATQLISDPISLDLAILDLTLSNDDENSGENLAEIIQVKFPLTKIVIVTSHVQIILLYEIVKKVAPLGFLVKSDFSPDQFKTAVGEIIEGKKYYSTTVEKSLREISKPIYLDNYNRQIISLLNRGVKTKNMPGLVNLSLSAIDKRKVIIKEFFDIAKGDDEEILKVAKLKGFI